jgi:hypothetical protein
MTEMEQEQRVNLYTDEIIRKALDIKAAKANIVRLKSYYNDPNNGMNTAFIVQRIKELEQLINQLNK